MVLRWGIVGCGNISTTYVTALSFTDPKEHQVVCVGASSLERAEAFKAKLGLSATAVGSYAAVFADPDVDVVYVGNQNHQHLETTMAALKAGKHVLCEKPLGLNAQQVDAMLAAAKDSGKLLMEGFWSRCFPAYRRLRSELASGAYGAPKVVTSTFGKNFGDALLIPEIGGSSLTFIGCYCIQFGVMVFGSGPVQVVSATAELTDKGMDRQVAFTLRWPCGGLGQFLVSSAVELGNDAWVFCEKGKFRLPSKMWCPSKLEHPTEGLLDFPLPPGPENNVFGNRTGFQYEAHAVKDAVDKGLTEAPEMTHEDSRRVIAIMDEIRRQIGVKFIQD